MSDPAEIFNWLRIDEHITTSGQPTVAQIAELKALGVTHLVNLAPHDHEKSLADEAGIAARLGMAYIHIPVDFAAPTEADFLRFRETMDELAGRRVHLHCIANARVTAFLYRYRRDVLGLDEAVARSLMERVWRPGGVWAAFIGDQPGAALPHRYARRDYAVDPHAAGRSRPI